MKKILSVAAVLTLAAPAFCESQKPGDYFGVIEWTAKERDSNYDVTKETVSEIASDSTLSIVFVGWEGTYQIIGEKPGEVRVFAEGAGEKPTSKSIPEGGIGPEDIIDHYRNGNIDIKVTYDNYINIGISEIKEGDTINISAWPKGHPQCHVDYVITVTKFGFKWFSFSNFSLAPLLSIEIGKKNGEDTEVTEGTVAGGVQYLFFYKARKRKLLDNIGWGFNNVYSKTPQWNEETRATRDTVVGTFGLALAYKPDTLPIFFTGGAGYNLNGPDKFLQVVVGIGTSTAK